MKRLGFGISINEVKELNITMWGNNKKEWREKIHPTLKALTEEKYAAMFEKSFEKV